MVQNAVHTRDTDSKQKHYIHSVSLLKFSVKHLLLGIITVTAVFPEIININIIQFERG